jgi:hypothetical protein
MPKEEITTFLRNVVIPGREEGRVLRPHADTPIRRYGPSFGCGFAALRLCGEYPPPRSLNALWALADASRNPQ